MYAITSSTLLEENLESASVCERADYTLLYWQKARERWPVAPTVEILDIAA